MKILILEDNEDRIKNFKQKFIEHSVTVTEYSKEAIRLLNENDYDELYLDHDLGGQVYVQSGEDTGYEVAKWLSEKPQKQPKKIYIHSFNPVGVQNMLAALPNAKYNHLAWLTDEQKNKIN